MFEEHRQHAGGVCALFVPHFIPNYRKRGGLTVISAVAVQKMFMQREKGRRGRGRAEG